MQDSLQGSWMGGMSNMYTPQNYNNSPKRLERSMSDKYIAGVCGSIARYFGVDATLIRIIFIALVLAGVMPGVLAYIIAWVIMPAEF